MIKIFLEMGKRTVFFTVIIVLIFYQGCTPSKIKTFLDFELGMSYVDYSNHAVELRKNLIIQDLNPNDYKSFRYGIKLNDSDYVFFGIHAYIYPSSKLTMISGSSSQILNLSQKQRLVEIFAANNGAPTTPLTEYDDHIWRAEWSNNKNIDVRLVFSDSADDQTKTYFHFMATGKFSEKIDPDNRIKIKNKY